MSDEQGKGPTDILEGTQQFMEAAGQLDNPGFPTDWHDELRRLRRRLVSSEFNEFMDGEAADDRTEVADGLLDIMVTAWGSMLAYFGPELSLVLAGEVADSNLSKILPDGSVIKDAGGKVMKNHEFFRPARIAELLAEWDAKQGS